MTYLNFYVHCQNEWTNEWECMCNDECPVCRTKDIQPYQSQEIKADGTLGEIIRHVPENWAPDGGWAKHMIPGRLLYRSDNGVHELWEREDHELLILRNHGESHWTAHRNHGFLFGYRSETEAATRLKVYLSNSHVWVQKKGKFALEVCSEDQQRPLGLDLPTANSADN